MTDADQNLNPENPATEGTAAVQEPPTAPTSTEPRMADADSAADVASTTATRPAAKKAAAKTTTAKKTAAKKTAAKKTTAKKTAAKKATAKKTTSKKTATATSTGEVAEGAEPSVQPEETAAGAAPAAARATKRTASRTAKNATAEPLALGAGHGEEVSAAPMVLFQAPEVPATIPSVAPAPGPRATARPAASDLVGEPAEDGTEAAGESDVSKEPAKKSAKSKKGGKKGSKKEAADTDQPAEGGVPDGSDNAVESQATEGSDRSEAAGSDDDGEQEPGGRRRRRRGGRRRRRSGGADASEDSSAGDADDSDENGTDADAEDDSEGSSRRRRTRVRKPRNPEDEITSVSGSTRLEAKKQRRREGREAGRRRAPIVSEAEFLARRESVDRVMVIRQRDDLTQIAVLEDKVLVEHYVARESQTSLIGNIYLGRVQNVLPSMEAAFIDIGKGRNAVLYAGEVNWTALGHPEGQPRKIESVLTSGQAVLVQVTKDPIGHKGARLTGQISLPGRFLVYVPDGTTSGISRKLPDTERSRLKALLKEIVPDTAGVIVRTAAEGASEDELTRDVERLTARWQDIEAKVADGRAPQLLYGEPDLTLKVVRDLFTEDFSKLVVQGDDAWDLVDGYVSHVAPDLRERLERFPAEGDSADGDVFVGYRIDEQIAKALDRKVWLPSGGSLIIDRTEAMTVVDVNTGKFTGSGGNLEETVTKNNLEAAEEVVRQLRLRDIGGIIVIDFIDMVLESNRDLVLRRLVECLGRDRTRHQVAEVTSLGLVQMTRKRIGTGLVEAFSHECEHCKGRGLVLHEHPVEPTRAPAEEPRGRRGRGGRGRGRGNEGAAAPVTPAAPPSPKDIAAMKPHLEPEDDADRADEPVPTTMPAQAGIVDASPVAAGEVVPDATHDDPSAAILTEPSDATAAGPDDVAPVGAPPTVVTSTRRRRRAARPAGPPVVAASQAAAVEETEAAAPAVPPDDLVAEPTEPVAEEMAATPPEEATTVDEAADTGPGEGESSVTETPVLHVPVKKKGSRKR